ncbi:MAG TPA: replication initiator protein A [Candidatus Avoscillospira avicola]|uniref:Replication initiator protein A n=1 Tax=Candidatus Avoscillospira avicola TaxID=2840706 RepID=A0A9D1AQQ0_9FIRM|nr:replication initiator protein A [Candidatus Avoscillospira avicola]
MEQCERTPAKRGAYLKLPKALLTEPRYRRLSDGAKLFYGMLLDRLELSVKNGWEDEAGRSYIYFTVESATAQLCCGRDKVTGLFRALEEAGLIRRHRQGLGRPSRIYVLEPREERAAAEAPADAAPVAEIPAPDGGNPDMETPENSAAESGETRRPEAEEPGGNQTEEKETDYNKTEQNHPDPTEDAVVVDWTGEDYRARFRNYFQWRFEWEYLLEAKPQDRERLEEILELLVDTVCTARTSFTFGGEKRPASVVKSRLLDLDRWHVEYVLETMGKGDSPIRNVRNYLLTALYNAPLTMENYYRTKVEQDMRSFRTGGG